jgi:integrase
MKLTAKTIDAVQLPAGKKDHFEWDDDLPGFGLRIREGGSRGWVFQYTLGKKQRRMSLGAATAESCKTIKGKDGELVQIGIRERVAQLQARVKLGQDPAGEKAESREHAAETFEAIGREWLTRKKEKLRPGSYRHLERHILTYAKRLHELNLAGLSRRTIDAAIEAAASNSGKVSANRMQATLHEFFTWAMGKGYIGQNPLIGREAFDEKPRDRVLTDDELREIWEAAGDDHYGSVIKLLMLLGQRADEIASLRRSEIGKAEVKEVRIGDVRLSAFTIDAIDLPPERTKNKRRHIIPLTKLALAILEEQPVRVDDDGKVRDLVFGIGQQGFSGWSRSKQRLDERIHAARTAAWKERGRQGDKPPPLPAWVHHTLRHTMVTVMNDRLGVLPHVVEAVVGHVSSAASGKAGVAGTYNHAVYLRERVEALKLWGDHIQALVGENVIPLRAAQA